MKYFENDTIRLRPLEPEDIDALYRWENDTRIWQYGATINPYSKFVLKQYITDSQADIYQTRQLRLMVVEKESERAVGTVDLYDFDFLHQRVGIGLLIDEDFREKGFASQALECVERYVFRHLSMNQLYVFIPSENLPSLSLFKKTGYEQTAVLKKWLSLNRQFTDVVVMQKFNCD